MRFTDLGEKKLFYVSNYGESSIYLVDLENSVILKKIKVGLQPYDLVVNKDTLFVANSGSDTVSIIKQNKVIREFEVCNNGHMEVSISGDKLYISDINNVALYDLKTYSFLNKLDNFNNIRFIKLNHFTNKLFVLEDKHLKIYDSLTLKFIKEIEVGLGASFIEFNEENKIAYISNTIANSLSVVNLEDFTILSTLKNIAEGPMGLKCLNKSLYIVSNLDNSVKVLDVKSNKITTSISVCTGPEKIVLCNKNLVVNNTAHNSVSIINSDTNSFIKNVYGFTEPIGIGVISNEYSMLKNKLMSKNYINLKTFILDFTINQNIKFSTKIVYNKYRNFNEYRECRFKNINFLTPCIIPNFKKLIPTDEFGKYKITIFFKVPYILNYNDLKGNMKSLKDTLEFEISELEIYIPQLTNKWKIGFSIGNEYKLLETPKVNDSKFILSLNILSKISIFKELNR